MSPDLTAFCYGIAFAAALSAGLFFLQFWRRSGDALFAWFAAAFALFAVQYLALAISNPDAETRPYYYMVRLLAFLLIIAGVLQKNRRTATPARRSRGRDDRELPRLMERQPHPGGDGHGADRASE
jgi:hypothetical protein